MATHLDRVRFSVIAEWRGERGPADLICEMQVHRVMGRLVFDKPHRGDPVRPAAWTCLTNHAIQASAVSALALSKACVWRVLIVGRRVEMIVRFRYLTVRRLHNSTPANFAVLYSNKSEAGSSSAAVEG